MCDGFRRHCYELWTCSIVKEAARSPQRPYLQHKAIQEKVEKVMMLNYLFISIVHDLLDITIQLVNLNCSLGVNHSTFLAWRTFCTQPCAFCR